MFGLKVLTPALALLATLLAAALARPQGHLRPRSLDLSAMINNTVCAIEVEYDRDPQRVPEVIKQLRCKSDTDAWCKDNAIRRHDCCHHRLATECVEMTDTVTVFNKARARTETLEVSVGCACMIRHTTQAPGLPPPP